MDALLGLDGLLLQPTVENMTTQQQVGERGLLGRHRWEVRPLYTQYGFVKTDWHAPTVGLRVQNLNFGSKLNSNILHSVFHHNIFCKLLQQHSLLLNWPRAETQRESKQFKDLTFCREKDYDFTLEPAMQWHVFLKIHSGRFPHFQGFLTLLTN